MRTDQHPPRGAFLERAAFPRLAEAVGPARDWVRRAYEQAGGKQGETCALLVSELFTNAVRYAVGDRVMVTVWDSLEVDVMDASPEKPLIQMPDDDAESGRGLLLVSELSSHFDVILFEDGKISRFRLDES
jgi:anti-sigma regulatory factor (Ser/Thr protein kinase)